MTCWSQLYKCVQENKPSSHYLQGHQWPSLGIGQLTGGVQLGGDHSTVWRLTELQVAQMGSR